MVEEFDREKAKKFLLAKEEKEKEQKEKERSTVLQKTLSFLQKEFKGSTVEVYLVGSILQPFQFSTHSDVDIVLKNYQGDRFNFWIKLEKEIGRRVEIIPFETCRFQEFVLKNGYNIWKNTQFS